MPTGFILISCENSHEDYVIEQLKKINAVCNFVKKNSPKESLMKKRYLN